MRAAWFPSTGDVLRNLDGDEVSIEADELLARLFQHELDHLDGKLLLDMLDDDQRKEALRTLRMIHHAAWLARRWEDPAFPIAFPWFGEPRYWEDLVLSLREQLGRMQEPALELPI